MPLLRYWTDDLVEQGPRYRRTGERGIRFLGRLGQSIVEGDEVVLGGQAIVEALEPEPLVARHLHPMERLAIIPPSSCGAVKYELGKRRTWLRVELTFDPRAYPSDAEALGQRVGDRLLAASPVLRAKERRGRLLDVELVGPSTLSAAWMKW